MSNPSSNDPLTHLETCIKILKHLPPSDRHVMKSRIQHKITRLQSIDPTSNEQQQLIMIERLASSKEDLEKAGVSIPEFTQLIHNRLKALDEKHPISSHTPVLCLKYFTGTSEQKSRAIQASNNLLDDSPSEGLETAMAEQTVTMEESSTPADDKANLEDTDSSGSTGSDTSDNSESKSSTKMPYSVRLCAAVIRFGNSTDPRDDCTENRPRLAYDNLFEEYNLFSAPTETKSEEQFKMFTLKLLESADAFGEANFHWLSLRFDHDEMIYLCFERLSDRIKFLKRVEEETGLTRSGR